MNIRATVKWYRINRTNMKLQRISDKLEEVSQGVKNYSGASVSSLSNYENEITPMPIDTFCHISKIFGITCVEEWENIHNDMLNDMLEEKLNGDPL